MSINLKVKRRQVAADDDPCDSRRYGSIMGYEIVVNSSLIRC